MKPAEFLYQELEKISKGFPHVYIKYAYNNVIRTHIVELLPLEEYMHNAELDDAWIPLSFRFRTAFPAEEISFVSSDSKLSVKNSSFEFNIPIIDANIIDANIIDAIYTEFSETEIRYSFPTSIPVDTISIVSSITNVLRCPKQNLATDFDDVDNFYQVAA